MKTALAVSLACLAFSIQPAFAGECDQWSASMEETEGGSEMVARTCMPDGDAIFELTVSCGSPGQLMLRMIPVAPESFPPGGFEYKSRFTVSVDGKPTDIPMVYEAMDGAMSSDLDIKGPLLAAMMSGKKLDIVDSKGQVPASGYTLEGAKTAIATVIKECRVE